MARKNQQMLQKGAIKNMDKGTLKRLLSYLKPYRIKLIIVAMCIILSTLASVFSSLFIQSLIDDYVTPMLTQAVPDFGPLAGAVLKLTMILLAGVFAGFFYNRTMAVVSQGTLKIIRDDMFTHMQTLPVKYFDQHTIGDIMSHYTNDADTLRQMISQTLPSLVSSVLTMAGVFASMIHLSVWLTLLTVGFAFFSLFLAKKIAGKSAKYFVKQQKSLGGLNGFIEEMINGQKVIKVFNHERKSEMVFDEKNEELRKNMSIANGLSMAIMPMMGNLGNTLYVLVAFVGGALALSGVSNLSIGGEPVMTLGTIGSFLILSRNFMNPITQVSQQLNSVIMALAGASRIFSLIDEKPEIDEGTVTLKEVGHEKWVWQDGDKEVPLEGQIELDDIDFGYSDEKKVLHDISLIAYPGQKIAFVGATGAGKTTITNLINRFYDVQVGKITYDGIDVKRIKKDDLRSSLGIVLQDVHLFTGTIMDNIRYGKLDATDEECIEAAKLANADTFIRMLPEGYNTVLEGDGAGISQGQRQLLSIARAAVLDPPVMILDEATSSIDTRTESIVQKGMDNLMKGRTVFVIAHRLSTVQNSDYIMVMENGRIIERGKHQELLDLGGKYFELYNGGLDDLDLD